MNTVGAARASDSYALGRTAREYDRLRDQSHAWEPATRQLLDQIALAPGARCLDAGCGPGETMRLLAERVGPTGHVTGVDIDADVGSDALMVLQETGHPQCEFVPFDLTYGEVPGGPYDLVYARLLLYHLPQRDVVLRRLWNAVTPGGHLLVQDYDLRAAGVLPALASFDELIRVIVAAFTAAGCDVHVGTRLPELFARAGVGRPDGTDVAGRLDTLVDGHTMVTGVYRSVLPGAIARGITTDAHAAAVLAEATCDVARFPERGMMWPLLVGAWRQKPLAAEPELVR